LRLTCATSRTTFSRAVANSSRYRAKPTTTNTDVVTVNDRCRLPEFLICGATTNARAMIVTAVPTKRKLASFARSCGT
jgi:hypothetical protein